MDGGLLCTLLAGCAQSSRSYFLSCSVAKSASHVLSIRESPTISKGPPDGPSDAQSDAGESALGRHDKLAYVRLPHANGEDAVVGTHAP